MSRQPWTVRDLVDVLYLLPDDAVVMVPMPPNVDEEGGYAWCEIGDVTARLNRGWTEEPRPNAVAEAVGHARPEPIEHEAKAVIYLGAQP